MWRASGLLAAWIVLAPLADVAAAAIPEDDPRRPTAARRPLAVMVAQAQAERAPTIEAKRRPGEIFRDGLVDGKSCSSACPEMMVIPAGSFTMGSPPSEVGRYENEGPQRRVVIQRPLAVSRFEVSFEEWGLCAANGGCQAYAPEDEGWGRGRRPVIRVSWEDAAGYAAWLAERTGRGYRLLSEAEWEYAARAITDGRPGARYYWGENMEPGNANCLGCGGQAANQPTLPVGSFSPNAFGLHDMLGNVWEWVSDPWHDNYVDAPADGRIWSSAGDSTRRVIRGGAWSSTQRGIRSANRNFAKPTDRADFIGFRVARMLDPQ